MQICLKSGHQLSYDEVNKVFIEDGYMTLSTFRGQYTCINVQDIASFELKYPQNKAPKAFAIFKQLLSQIKNENKNKTTEEVK